MDSRLYPQGKGGVHSKYNKDTGVLEFFDSSNTFIYAIDPATQQVFGPSIVNFIRTQFTTAQVNAGATLLAAKPGYKYKMIDAAMIAIGGNAATVTTVDILATLSTSRKLMAGAQANLTQSTVIHAGETGGAVLADGASFTANDANTAITIGKTGSDLATATHIDVLFSYVVEAA
jgi:hypothetical protein